MCMKIFLHTMSLPLQVIASQKQLEAKYKQAQATAVRGRPRRGRGLAWEGASRLQEKEGHSKSLRPVRFEAYMAGFS